MLPPEKPNTAEEKLDLEVQKLRRDLLEYDRPYVFRNPQLLTATIATIGAILALSVAISKDYFQILKERNELALEKATRQRAEADKTLTDARADLARAAAEMKAAERSKAEADEISRDARGIVARSYADMKRAQVASEEAQAAAMMQSQQAQNVIKQAEADVERATAAVREQEELAAKTRESAIRAQQNLRESFVQLFKEWRLPQYILDQQHQLRSLRIDDPISSCAWISNEALKRLSVSLPEQQLATIPATVEELTLQLREMGDDLNLDQLRSPALKRLTISTRATYLTPLQLYGSPRTPTLESLSIKLPVALTREGLDVSRLSHFGIYIRDLNDIPGSLLASADELELTSGSLLSLLIRLSDAKQGRAKPLPRFDRLRTVTLETQVNAESLALLSEQASVTNVFLPHGCRPPRAALTLPTIKTLGILLEEPSQAASILQMFPHLTDLRISGGSVPASRIGHFMAQIAQVAPRLEHLSIVVYSPQVSEPVTLQIPRIPALKSLAISTDPAVKVSAKDLKTLGRMQSLTISAANIPPGDLGDLGQLDTLILRDVDDPRYLDAISSLVKLRTLGVDFADAAQASVRASARAAMQQQLRAALQRMLGESQIERLIIPSRMQNAIDRLAPSIQHLEVVRSLHDR